jgi:excisionase family DNA binding protein
MPLIREILTPQEVADYLQLTPGTVYRYIREGRLVASQLGRQYRIRRQNVELLLLATASAGDARMRAFTKEETAAWLDEDRIGEDTQRKGEELLAKLSAGTA